MFVKGAWKSLFFVEAIRSAYKTGCKLNCWGGELLTLLTKVARFGRTRGAFGCMKHGKEFCAAIEPGFLLGRFSLSSLGENRMVGLPEIAARTGLSKGFFYNYRSMGRLSLPLRKVGGRLQVSEQDLEGWIRRRAILDSSCMAHLGEELLVLIGAAGVDPEISAEKYPGVLWAFAAKVDGAFGFAVESMKGGRQIGLEEFVERFEFIANQVDAELTEGLPEAAQLVFSPLFYDCVMRWRQSLFDYVEQEYRKVFQGQVRAFLYGIRYQHWKTGEEKLEAVRFYVPEGLWVAAGFSREERSQMVGEVVVEEGRGAKQ